MYDTNFMEKFSLDIINDIQDQLFTEAVFSGGRDTVLPLVAKIQQIKDLLENQIQLQDSSFNDTQDTQDTKSKQKENNKVKTISKVKSFDPKLFWKNILFKELEDQIGSIFGFRNVEIHPYIEKYNSKTKIFESKIMNCEIYHSDRYPIEGIVTDKGFYDKSKSLIMQIHISLGLLRSLDADELLAVILHEFGHSIDPAIVDIKYTEINILSKYLTDRKSSINKNEEKLLNHHSISQVGGIMIFYILVLFSGVIVKGISKLIDFISEKILGKDKVMEQKLKKVVKLIEFDKLKFNRKNYGEAYADNFARMYGFGPQLIKALHKISAEQNRELKSRFKKEKARQECIMYITEALIQDVHKTDIHRIRNLISEYKIDIGDPNISTVTKKQLEDDLIELEKVLDQYLNNFDEFQNRVNKVINEELQKVEANDIQKDENNKEEEIKEGFMFFENDELFEEKHPLEQEMEKKCPLNRGDLEKIREKFGHSRACSFAKDKDGYFAYTHRCRCKSSETIDDMSQKDIDFVRSTS